jgi:hypothetical protein
MNYGLIKMNLRPLADGTVCVFIFRLFPQHHFEAALHGICVVEPVNHIALSCFGISHKGVWLTYSKIFRQHFPEFPEQGRHTNSRGLAPAVNALDCPLTPSEQVMAATWKTPLATPEDVTFGAGERDRCRRYARCSIPGPTKNERAGRAFGLRNYPDSDGGENASRICRHVVRTV